MRRFLVALIAAASLCGLLHAASAAEKKKAPAPKPDATVQLKGTSVGVGVGFSWGSGFLSYHGKHYPISVDGLDIADVGITKATATGKVYDLKKLSDFDGNYASVGAAGAVGGGGGIVTMKNQNGVKIDLVSTTQGVKVALAAGGVNMKIKQ